MDEQSFDRIIKQKVANYEDPTFDETALTQFQKRMSTVQRLSWYKQYRTEIIVISAFILFTLLNGYIVGSALKERNVTTPNISATSTAYTNTYYLKHIDSLETLIVKLKEANAYSQPSIYTQIPYNSSTRKSLITSQEHVLPDQTIPNNNILLGNTHSLPISLISLLGKNDLLVTKNGNAYLVIHEVKDKTLFEYPFNTITNRSSIIYLPTPVELEQPKEDIHEKNASAKVMNDLQKHYFHGLGINIAPHADMVLNAFNHGKGVALTPRVGATFDWVVSPHLSFETSLDYMTTRFSVDNDFEKWHIEDLQDESFGSLQKATFTTRTLSLPISIKYRKWISPKNEMIVRGSFNTYYALRQSITCSYAIQNGNTYGGNGNNNFIIDRTQINNLEKMYGSTIGASIGLQHVMRPKTKTEISLFYEKSLGTVGPQKNGMQLYGLKAAYWFKVK